MQTNEQIQSQTSEENIQQADITQMENISESEFHDLSDNDKLAFNNMYPDKFEKKSDNQSDEKIFGKFTSIEEAKKGYENAVKKITDQGKALNEYKQNSKPVEDYTPEQWNTRVENIIKEKGLSEDINLDPSIPEINMLMHGLQKAGVTESQVNNIVTGLIEKHTEIIEERKESFLEEIGSEGQAKIKDIEKIVRKMNNDDQLIVSEMLAVPYVNKEQLDFFHRMLCNNGELTIPENINTQPNKTASDVYKEITEFNKLNGDNLVYNPELQKEEARLWEEYSKLKK